nr:hypothetical protein [Synechococcus sp. UW105]
MLLSVSWKQLTLQAVKRDGFAQWFAEQKCCHSLAAKVGCFLIGPSDRLFLIEDQHGFVSAVEGHTQQSK